MYLCREMKVIWMDIKPVTILLALVLAVFPAKAQEEYLAEPFLPDTPLCSASVPHILQDGKGFMWFGTPDGVDRYDGYETLHIPFPEGDNGYGNARTLCEDSQGNIWIGSYKGICIWDAKEQRIRRYSQTGVARIVKSRDGALWVAANYGGFLRIDPETGACDTLRFTYHNASAHFGEDVAYDGEDSVWFLNGVGAIYRCDIGSRDLETVVPYQQSAFHSRGITRFHYLDGILLAGTDVGGQGIYAFDTNNGVFAYYDHEDIRSCGTVSGGGHYITSASGIWVFRNGIRQALDHNWKGGQKIIDIDAISVFRDREGGYWIGTGGQGVVRLVPNAFSFKEIASGISVTALAKGPDGAVWIGTKEDGLFRYDPRTHVLESKAIGVQEVSALASCEDGLLIASSSPSRPLLLFNPLIGIARPYPFIQPELTCLMDMGNGTAYAGGWLQKLDLANEKTERIEYVRTPVKDMVRDKDGRVWVASSFAGVWKEENGRWTHLTDSSGVVMRTSAIYADDNHVWIGSPDDGLQCLDPKTGHTRIFSEFGGVSCQRIIDISADSDEGLWMATPSGFAFLNPENGETAFYSSADGLDASQAEFSVLKYIDGMLYVGNQNRLICFDPIQFRKVRHRQSPIVFTGFSIPAQLGKQEKRPLRGDLTDIDSRSIIKLKAQENTFVLGVSQMDYAVPRTTKLEFLLEGTSHPQWHPVEGGYITVTNLRQGRYNLLVRIVGRSSGELVGQREMGISVAPPPLASPLAIVLYLLFFAAGIIFLVERAQKRAFRKASLEAEQRDAENQKRLYASKVEFLTTLAHEIRTPLTLVMAPVETLQSKLAHSADKSVVEDLDVVGRNADKLSMLLDELLDFRKLENSGIKLMPAEYDIAAIVRSAVGRFSLAAGKKGIKLNLELPQESVSAAVDKNALDKIITNLLSNAIKYGMHKVEVSLKESDGQIRLVMENDGPAVPLQDRERIFHPFERYVPEGSNETGTGIGLFVSRNLAELHGGTLTMDKDISANRFILSIPVVHISEEIPEPKTLPDIHIPQQKPTVLVVEDSREMLDFIRRQLEMVYSVITAGNGEEALSAIAGSPVSMPDCIISDVMMPVMDGYQLCRQLKSDEKTAHIPFVLLTALADTDSRMVGLTSGADAYLSKPFSPGELLSLIGSLLQNREILKKKYSSLPATQYQDISADSQDVKFLRTIDAFVQAHLADDPLSVEMLATEACMSTSSLFKKMKHLVGMGPGEYIMTARLKQGAALLKNTDLPIAEIATRTGFRSPSYFASCFKASFGITPKQYRKVKPD